MLPLFLASDLDNTLILYGSLFRTLALEKGLVSPDVAADKNAVRRVVRALPDGESLWRELQAEVYGERIQEAEVAPQARQCLEALAASGARLAVVSHKTRHAHHPFGHVDLREAAMTCLEAKNLLHPGGPLDPGSVFFEQTRQEKLARIAALNPTHFLDDLPEVLGHECFPEGVARILYDQTGTVITPAGVGRAGSWRDVWCRLTGQNPTF
ncbi:HAD family hydrolase [Fundidesulfovibrio putealis]|uniref:hypothetical protein n=1 Tax=Fundidesulfovibrio putealis TaxID=270496 RepID=UPI00041EC330|nr:hypothetical protein [Fundidesulfovibrio putealis]